MPLVTRDLRLLPALLLLLLLPIAASNAAAQETAAPEASAAADAPTAVAAATESSDVAAAASPAAPTLTEAYRSADSRVVLFSEHVAVLSSPWMEGRLPGTRGMERAREYMEWHFRRAGLEPAVPMDGGDGRSFRQPFELGANPTFSGQSLEVFTDDASASFELGRDFELTSLGGGGEIEGPLAFVGYSVEEGPEGYTSFREEEDLAGKVAVMLRFEPMDEEGESLWSDRGWSSAAGFNRKFSAIARRNPAAVILVNPPGAADPRAARLSRGGGSMIDCPVVMMTPEAAERLVRLVDAEDRGIADWRRHADEGGLSFDLPAATARVAGVIEETPVVAENVVGLLPGRGAFADEFIVIGAHLDHLGNGDFGSRRGAGQLHPGADDNASGSAGIMLIADALAARYAAMPAESDLRSILFIGFDAEESGLNGARHYVRNPLAPLAKHSLMFNFDMIGRIENRRLRLAGLGSGEGLKEWAQGFYSASGLEIVEEDGGGGGSDHAAFASAGVPVLFAIIADFHGDYHTPDDTAEKINREDAVRAADLFTELAFAAAIRPEMFAPAASDSGNRMRGGQRLAVRVGMRSRNGSDGGLEVVEVTPDGPAAAAGLQAGDLIVLWDKEPIASRQELVDRLRAKQAGDVVSVTYRRDGQEQLAYLTLVAAE
jgi:hypothetical protein